MFRLLISGSRDWELEEILRMKIIQKWIEHPDLVVVFGDCPTGADAQAKKFCEEYDLSHEDPYEAEWGKYGNGAGPIRNQRMVDTKPDYALFFMTPNSRGTKDCLRRAIEAGIPYEVYGRQ